MIIVFFLYFFFLESSHCHRRRRQQSGGGEPSGICRFDPADRGALRKRSTAYNYYPPFYTIHTLDIAFAVWNNTRHREKNKILKKKVEKR